MSTTLYGTFPVLLPAITESVSPYGLKKTTGTILFKPNQEFQAINLANNNGQLFPEPQIRTTDMGLLEMSFDAYRDTGPTTGVYGIQVLNFSKSFSEVVPPSASQPEPILASWTVSEVWVADTYTDRVVLSANRGSISLSVSKKALSKRMLARTVTGKKTASGTASLSLMWDSQVTSVTRRNFGAFDEVDIVTSLTATVS